MWGMLINSMLTLQHEGRYAEQVLQPFFGEEWDKVEKGLTV